MEKVITLLDEVKESIINAYESKTHLSRSKIAKMMSDETWLNARKALELGFVDGILFSEKKQKSEKEDGEQKPEKDTEKDLIESMQYSPTTTASSLMLKISAMSPVKGVPIDQLDKRLALLKV